ncbi:hypothetical protein [Pseudoalteromonas piscicida]|uniref:hypothetical protein n=1 Tax=Pseudoalteromonas piscicida TaxID=43662 RepID=UPI0030972512
MNSNDDRDIDMHEQARVMYYRACIAEFQQLGYQEAFLDEILRQRRVCNEPLHNPNPLQNE